MQRDMVRREKGGGRGVKKIEGRRKSPYYSDDRYLTRYLKLCRKR